MKLLENVASIVKGKIVPGNRHLYLGGIYGLREKIGSFGDDMPVF